MRYFLLRLGLALILSVAFLVLFLYLVHRVKKAHLKHRLGYFSPVILAFVSALFIARQSGPMALDLLNIYRDQYQVKQVEVETVKVFHRCLMSDGDSYFYNGFKIKPEVGRTYQITYTKWSRYIIGIREI